MDNFNRFGLNAALYGGVLLLCFSLTVGADEIQDINKLFKQNQHAQALKRVDTYLTNKPNDAQARFLKGLILTTQLKTNDAIEIFLSLTEDYPELPEPYNNLAVLYAGQGQYDKAKVALERAIHNHPNYATAQENLGDIYAKMASQAYERALQLDRNNTATQTKLALIQDLFSKSKPSTATASAAKPQAAIPGAAPVPSKVATAVPVVASSTKPAIVKKLADYNSAEVLKTLHEWVEVWSSQNVRNYLDFYAIDFKTPNGESRDQWEKETKVRISAPKYIEINISNEKVSFSDESHATITFHQSYRSDYLNTSFDKIMRLVKLNNKWLIQEERAAK
ncbi:MAG: tetratricopeptide repeat protein [Betaproteobacteria bacterium]|nr:tetratricopeptide repeat protein [Betaproteobacteria bacterium]MCX7195290.1 tetratricopeptide repeat protein [Pseudomonadota bacterium]